MARPYLRVKRVSRYLTTLVLLTDNGNDMFSDTVLSTLAASGWTPNRKTPTAQWVGQLESEGFTMLPEAVSVLEGFGGLEIVPWKSASDAYAAEVLRFDPILAASGEFDRIDYWQSRLNTRLSPIGETGGGAILLLAEDGRVFSCWDGVLWLDGTSFQDALENTLIVAKRKPLECGRMSH
jgi:SUKH-3 immunity protein